MSAWITGEVGVISLSAATEAGLPTDPASVVLKIKDPTGTISTYTHGTDADLVKDSTGEYHMNIELSLVGKWYWRWEVGTPDGAVEGSVRVKQSAIVAG